MSENVHFMNSCWSLPALRQTRVAFLMCSPSAQASISLGEALSTFLVMWKSCIATLPAPMPPPADAVPVWCSDQLNDSSWISPLCLESADSPSIPSTLRNASNSAIAVNSSEALFRSHERSCRTHDHLRLGLAAVTAGRAASPFFSPSPLDPPTGGLISPAPAAAVRPPGGARR